jgi:hypothetical protein
MNLAAGWATIQKACGLAAMHSFRGWTGCFQKRCCQMGVDEAFVTSPDGGGENVQAVQP